MSRHKHHDVIVAWAADTSKVVQCFDLRKDQWVDHIYEPQWYLDREYRLKPEPKPDVVQEIFMSQKFYVAGHGDTPPRNLRLTFDGETGKLKSAEVL